MHLCKIDAFDKQPSQQAGVRFQFQAVIETLAEQRSVHLGGAAKCVCLQKRVFCGYKSGGPISSQQRPIRVESPLVRGHGKGEVLPGPSTSWVLAVAVGRTPTGGMHNKTHAKYLFHVPRSQVPFCSFMR